MTAKEFVKYMLAPAIVLGVIIQNVGWNLPAFSLGETISIFMALGLALGWVAYKHELERRTAIEEAKAKAQAEYERLCKEFAVDLQVLKESPVWDEVAQYYWARNFDTIMSWRDDIGADKKEESLWDEE